MLDVEQTTSRGMIAVAFRAGTKPAIKLGDDNGQSQPAKSNQASD